MPTARRAHQTTRPPRGRPAVRITVSALTLAVGTLTTIAGVQNPVTLTRGTGDATPPGLALATETRDWQNVVTNPAAWSEAHAGSTVEFELTRGLVAETRIEATWRSADGSETQHGTVLDPRGPGSYTVTVRDGRIRGTFNTPDGRFAMVPTPTGHAVVEMGGPVRAAGRTPRWDTYADIVGFDETDRQLGLARAWDHPDARLPVSAAAPANVTILMAYTTAARTWMDQVGMDAALEMQHLVDRANAALGRGGTHTRLELVDTMQTNHRERYPPEPGPGAPEPPWGIYWDLLELSCENAAQHGSDCAQLQRGRGSLTDVRERRTQLGADLVHLITGRSEARLTDSPVGVAWKPASYQAFSREAGYGVSELLATLRSEVFSHEIGHNFGLAHDRYVAGSFPGRETSGGPVRHFGSPEIYAHGYVNRAGLLEDSSPQARWRTIMAYDAECLAETPHLAHELHGVCRQIARFSTPDRTYNGEPTGIAGDIETYEVGGPADAARSIRRAARLVELYFDDVQRGSAGDQGLEVSTARTSTPRVGPGWPIGTAAFAIWRGSRTARTVVAEWERRRETEPRAIDWNVVERNVGQPWEPGARRDYQFDGYSDDRAGRYAYRLCVYASDEIASEQRICGGPTYVTISDQGRQAAGCDIRTQIGTTRRTTAGNLTDACSSFYWGDRVYAHRWRFRTYHEMTLQAEAKASTWLPRLTLGIGRTTDDDTIAVAQSQSFTDFDGNGVARIQRRIPAGEWILELAGQQEFQQGAYDGSIAGLRPEGVEECHTWPGRGSNGTHTVAWRDDCRGIEASNRYFSRTWSFNPGTRSTMRIQVETQEASLPLWVSIFSDSGGGRNTEATSGWHTGYAETTVQLSPGHWLVEVVTADPHPEGEIELSWTINPN